MRGLSLVTGANGHLGNNVVRALLARGERVRASVRNVNNTEPFEGLDVELVYADLQDKPSLLSALQGVDTLYQVAANFKHWAKDPQQEIINANITGTRNVIEAAAEAGVRRVVYVSSVAALDQEALMRGEVVTESDWNTNSFGNPYYQSKVDSERLALRLARELNLELVTVLPGAIVGPHCYRLTPTQGFIVQSLNNQIPMDVKFYFNFVHVEDVAEGMLAAAEHGRPGERYILATPDPLGMRDLVEVAREFVPDLRYPPRVPRPVVMLTAHMMKFGAHFTGQEPAIVPSMVRLFYDVAALMDISKAQKELGYNPRSGRQALRDAFADVMQKQAIPL